MLINELYERERHADFLRQAEQDRLIAKVETGRKPFYKPALKAVGVRLVEWGNRLQDNVESAAPAAMFSAGKGV